ERTAEDAWTIDAALDSYQRATALNVEERTEFAPVVHQLGSKIDAGRPDIGAWLRERTDGMVAIVVRLHKENARLPLLCMVRSARSLIEKLRLLGPVFETEAKAWTSATEPAARGLPKREWEQLEGDVAFVEHSEGNLPNPTIRPRFYELIAAHTPRCA